MQGGKRCEVRGVLSPYAAAPRERANAAGEPFSAACYRKASSTGTRQPVTSRLVSLAIPTTAKSSPNISSVMPRFLAAAVWEAMQYSQPWAMLTAR
jgi:hypothetical protein